MSTIKTITVPMLYLLLSLTILAAPETGTAFSLPGLSRTETVTPKDNAVTIPLSRITGEARYYTLKESGKEIRFFVVKGSKGDIHAAFDACDACFREKKGYGQKDDRMVCRNCNMKFPVDRLGPNAVGGCNPGYLPHRIEKAGIVITLSDLKAGARYF